jgi:GTPase SAR1 family protein
VLQQYVRGQFNSNVVATIGAAYMRKIVRIGGWDVCMMLWDTAGQFFYASCTRIRQREVSLVRRAACAD